MEEFIAKNADPIWLHENELWELMPLDDEACLMTKLPDDEAA